MIDISESQAAAVELVPAVAEQPNQEVLVGEPGEAAGVQLYRVGAGQVRPLRQGRDAHHGAPGAKNLELLRQDLQDGMRRKQLVHTGALVIVIGDQTIII
jgi:hypothetical protein